MPLDKLYPGQIGNKLGLLKINNLFDSHEVLAAVTSPAGAFTITTDFGTVLATTGTQTLFTAVGNKGTLVTVKNIGFQNETRLRFKFQNETRLWFKKVVHTNCEALVS